MALLHRVIDGSSLIGVLPEPSNAKIYDFGEEKIELWREKHDFGVFDDGDFKFWGLESKFERN